MKLRCTIIVVASTLLTATCCAEGDTTFEIENSFAGNHRVESQNGPFLERDSVQPNQELGPIYDNGVTPFSNFRGTEEQDQQSTGIARRAVLNEIVDTIKTGDLQSYYDALSHMGRKVSKGVTVIDGESDKDSSISLGMSPDTEPNVTAHAGPIKIRYDFRKEAVMATYALHF